MNGLLGIHMTPPEREVVPPTRLVFSSMSTPLPADRITSPAHMEPPPAPTTTKSKISSKTAMSPPTRRRSEDPNPAPSDLIQLQLLRSPTRGYVTYRPGCRKRSPA